MAPATNTNKIGPATVNRTANLPRELDLDFGRFIGENNAKSKSDVIKRLVNGLVSGAIKTSQLGLLVLVSLGLGMALAASVMPEGPLPAEFMKPAAHTRNYLNY